MDKEDKKYVELVNRFTKNEKKLKEENKKLKEEIELFKTYPTPEEFDKEYKREFKKQRKKIIEFIKNTRYDKNYAIRILKHNKERVIGWNDALNQVLEDIKSLN